MAKRKNPIAKSSIILATTLDVFLDSIMIKPFFIELY